MQAKWRAGLEAPPPTPVHFPNDPKVKDSDPNLNSFSTVPKSPHPFYCARQYYNETFNLTQKTKCVQGAIIKVICLLINVVLNALFTDLDSLYGIWLIYWWRYIHSVARTVWTFRESFIYWKALGQGFIQVLWQWCPELTIFIMSWCFFPPLFICHLSITVDSIYLSTNFILAFLLLRNT